MPEHEPTLRERGEDLLERSRDVWSDEEPHPAYVRILDDLAPDEARILVHMLRAGPQPAVDVRTGGPVGLVSSSLVASGLTMIGARAGVRYGDEVPAYLNNLFRLGLVWFSSEQVEDPMDYQVLEAQPDVLRGDALGALRQAGAPLDPPHAVRHQLLPDLPGRPRAGRRPARARGAAGLSGALRAAGVTQRSVRLLRRSTPIQKLPTR